MIELTEVGCFFHKEVIFFVDFITSCIGKQENERHLEIIEYYEYGKQFKKKKSEANGLSGNGKGRR